MSQRICIAAVAVLLFVRQSFADTEDYEAERIRFHDIAIVTGTGKSVSTGIATFAYRGDRRLSTTEFFEAVGRPDLVQRYERRRTIGKATLAASTVVLGVGAVIMITKAMPDTSGTSCIGADDTLACLDAEHAERERERREERKWLKIGGGVAAGGLVIGLVGFYFLTNANPISMTEAYDLADQHNAKLKRKHAVSASVVPYADPQSAGAMLVGRF